ncbi:hypothetical protein VNO77_25220 [Canavalia gladiata]|uniref:Uncharacterized protein n=1 Tax=Canavalia gladiata TaxID=3824 RepID=A0AAN9QDA2_CANGL
MREPFKEVRLLGVSASVVVLFHLYATGCPWETVAFGFGIQLKGKVKLRRLGERVGDVDVNGTVPEVNVDKEDAENQKSEKTTRSVAGSERESLLLSCQSSLYSLPASIVFIHIHLSLYLVKRNRDDGNAFMR